MALYLKYRPQNLDQLTGQDQVKKTLLEAYKSGKLSHAYLFVGPRGTGKTSTARILAKMVNCLVKEDVPCNKCDVCLSITDGSNLDLIEIDAASNRGIDDIRSLREKIKLVPSQCRKKVYIIDEVHMLTSEAFNALLKTLEEPPEHVLFILATTEVQKIPQTILSRVQRLDFGLATKSEISKVLEKIAKAEKIQIDEDALEIIVQKADGSFRDGVKLLDQVSSTDNKVTASYVISILKSTNFDDLVELLQYIADKKPEKALSTILSQVNNGLDVKGTMSQLSEVLHALILIKSGLGEEVVKPSWSEEKFNCLISLADKFSKRSLMDGLNILQESFEKLKYASIPSLPLELAVLEMCGVSENSKSVDHKETSNTLILSDAQETPAPLNSSTTEESVKVLDNSPDVNKLKEKWNFVLETIRPYNFSLEALLRSVAIAKCEETLVVIEVPYSFHKRILEAPKNRDLLESILSDILGRSVKLSVSLVQRPARTEDIANVEFAQDDEVIRIASEIFNSESVN